MSTAKIVLGDDVVLTVTLFDDSGDPVTLDEDDDTVLVQLNRVDGSAKLCDAVEADPDHADADWTNVAGAVIAVNIDGDTTAALTVAKIDVEVQVTHADDTQTTYFADVPLTTKKGLIP